LTGTWGNFSMEKGDTQRTAVKTALAYLFITIASVFLTNFIILGWADTVQLSLSLRLLISAGLATVASLFIYILFRKELNRMNFIIKDYADKKDSYHELYLNFNRINRELNNNNLQLQDANKKLEELDNLKNAFLANMSHEIRTPMNSIIGFSSLVCDEDLDPGKKKKFVRIIKSNSMQLLKIVNDILDLSKLETGQFKVSLHPFNLNKLIDDVLIYTHELVGVSNKPIIIRFSKGLKDGADIIQSDRDHLYQVFSNIIDNAVKFTKAGNIELGYRAKGEHVIEFYVNDTGKGISENMQSLIFERFRQEQESTNRRFGGTGLGLPISKGIIELLGGEIRVESKPMSGSTFYFTIPLKAMHEQIK